MRMAVPLSEPQMRALVLCLLYCGRDDGETSTYLQPLLHLLYKHVSVRCETVHSENGTVGSVCDKLMDDDREQDLGRKVIDAQSEDLGGIAGLDTVAFALPSVPRDDREVRTSDGEDCAAVVGVGVELALLGVCERTVRHGVDDGGRGGRCGRDG